MSRKCIVLLLTVALLHTAHSSVVSGKEDGNTGSTVTSHDHEDHDGHSSHVHHEGHDDDAGHEDHDDHESHDHDDTEHEDDDSHDDHEGHDHEDTNHEDHDDTEHEDHDHGDTEDEDDDSHDDHEGHDHEDTDHEGHDDDEHEDGDSHDDHDHGGAEHEDADSHDEHGHGDHADHGDHEKHDDHEGHDHGDHHEDFLPKMLEILNYKNMNKEALSKLIEKLRESVECRSTSDNICNQCITAEKIIAAAEISNSDFTEEEVEKISWILVYYMSTGMNATCDSENDIISPSNAATSLFPGIIFCQENFKLIAENLSSKICQEATRCLEHSFEKECLRTAGIEKESIMISIIYGIMTCRCKLPIKEHFIENLFEGFVSEGEKMSTSDFQKLLESLSIGGEFEVVEDEHAGHNHRRKREIDDHDHEDHEDHSDENFCYTANELLAIFNIDGASGIDRQQFTELSPALVQQISSNACVVEPVSSLPRDVNYTTAQKYGYGTASVLIISALSFLGLLVFPVIGTTAYNITMQFFIALGVGTMSGDALLHIIPEVVGLHVHAPGEIHVGEEEDKTYMWRLLVVVGGIYIFFLFESTIRIINQVRNVNITLHVHNHGTGDHDHSNETGNSRALRHTLSDAAAKSNEVEDGVSDAEKKEEKKKQEKVCGDLTTVALMVLIGDILHNFGDGIAIGVAFSTSWVAGIGTSIAIFCHELPHEFGDFAIYLNSGLSKCQALLANFAAACVAFVGLYIGLAVSNDHPEVRQWILSAIAGMFLYICFVDVLHEMIETKTKKPILQFLMQNLGLLLGWAILLVIAVYEDRIIGILA